MTTESEKFKPDNNKARVLGAFRKELKVSVRRLPEFNPNTFVINNFYHVVRVLPLRSVLYVKWNNLIIT